MPSKIQLLRSVSASFFCGFTCCISYLLNPFDFGLSLLVTMSARNTVFANRSMRGNAVDAAKCWDDTFRRPIHPEVRRTARCPPGLRFERVAGPSSWLSTVPLFVRGRYRLVSKIELNLCDSSPHLWRPATQEAIMPVALKQPTPSIVTAPTTSPWMHLVWFGAAGLFVSILAMTYGLDLSPGFF